MRYIPQPLVRLFMLLTFLVTGLYWLLCYMFILYSVFTIIIPLLYWILFNRDWFDVTDDIMKHANLVFHGTEEPGLN